MNLRSTAYESSRQEIRVWRWVCPAGPLPANRRNVVGDGFKRMQWPPVVQMLCGITAGKSYADAIHHQVSPCQSPVLLSGLLEFSSRHTVLHLTVRSLVLYLDLTCETRAVADGEGQEAPLACLTSFSRPPRMCFWPDYPQHGGRRGYASHDNRPRSCLDNEPRG